MKIALIGILLAVLSVSLSVWYINVNFTNKLKEFVAHIITAISIIAFVVWAALAPFLV
jgi:hypothetical protein